MTHEVFKQRLAAVYKQYNEPESSHEEADDFLIEVLEDMGFDLTLYKEATKWYA